MHPVVPRGILLMAHGTSDRDGQHELRRIARALQERTSLPVRIGALEYPSDVLPNIPMAADELVALGVREVAATPLLLLRAGHGKLDMPGVISALRHARPEVAFRLSSPLMTHPWVRRALHDRQRETVGGGEPDAVIIVGRGTHDGQANGDVYKVARQYAEETGQPLVEACFVSQARPSLPEAIERCRLLGAQSIVVLPYFLCTGVLIRRIHETVERIGPSARGQATRLPRVPAADAPAQLGRNGRERGLRLTVAPYLGAHPLLLQLLLLRANEAFRDAPVVECAAGYPFPAHWLPLTETAPERPHVHEQLHGMATRHVHDHGAEPSDRHAVLSV